MTIQEKIVADLTTAIKERNEEKKSLLRVVIGEFNRVGKTVSDEVATGVLKKMVQNAVDLKNDVEKVILEEYLPSQLSNESLSAIIDKIITDNGFTIRNLGDLMKLLKADYAGRYDGKFASEYARTVLK